jgi:hypothetical protein
MIEKSLIRGIYEPVGQWSIAGAAANVIADRADYAYPMRTIAACLPV